MHKPNINQTDIVTWCGIITTYGVIAAIAPVNEVYLADKNDVKLYNLINSK